jgi:hypothetical protein
VDRRTGESQLKFPSYCFVPRGATDGRVAKVSSSTESTSSIFAPLTPMRPKIAVKKAYKLSVHAIRKKKENKTDRIRFQFNPASPLSLLILLPRP